MAVYGLQRQRIHGWFDDAVAERNVAATAAPPPQATTPPSQSDSTQHYELPTVAREEEPSAGSELLAAAGTARIALVIDDLGRSLADIDRIEALGVAITYAVLPFETRTTDVSKRVLDGGHELICHLPMEPASGANPGPGALTSAMTGRQLAKATRAALRAVPGAVGVNNHMGSSLTADRRAMRSILRVVGNHNLYFLDSRTSADSVGFVVAREKGIPAAQRQVFLDGELSREWIDGQLLRAMEIAKRDGAAVVIGHPHRVTLDALADWVPEALAAGYEFVEVSKLLERSGGPAE